MRILLTGGNGFIGSHITDALLDAGHELTLLLRRTSDVSFIRDRLEQVHAVYGSLHPPHGLGDAVDGAEVVVHCAGKTKAVWRRDYYAVNEAGTIALLNACEHSGGSLRQFILLSSLAVTGPGTPQEPATEDQEPAPLSDYGRSKLLGERAVREGSPVPWTVLRPAAVYGPRDGDFHVLFKAVSSGIVPLIGGGRRPLSMVYATDLARCVLAVVGRSDAHGGVYHVAHPEPVTQRGLVDAVAFAMHRDPWAVPVPTLALYPLALGRDLYARLTGRASIMNLQKVPEYSAPGWVCSTEAARRALGFEARVALPDGVRHAAEWYRRQGWL